MIKHWKWTLYKLITRWDELTCCFLKKAFIQKAFPYAFSVSLQLMEMLLSPAVAGPNVHPSSYSRFILGWTFICPCFQIQIYSFFQYLFFNWNCERRMSFLHSTNKKLLIKNISIVNTYSSDTVFERICCISQNMFCWLPWTVMKGLVFYWGNGNAQVQKCSFYICSEVR